MKGLITALPPVLRPRVDEVVARYREPHRRYHGIGHLDALASEFEAVAGGPGWRAPAEVAAAMLFHDAVYVPWRRDNEERSAGLAHEVLDGGVLDVGRVERMIRATATHGRPIDVADDPDLAHFLDADLAILGAAPEEYARYEAGVRAEYAPWIPGFLYRRRREAFLAKLLRRDPLFHTAFFAERYEARGRENLAGALTRLRGG